MPQSPPDKTGASIDQAHQIFNQTSIHEVIDLPRGSATITMKEFYENAGNDHIEQYLNIIGLLKQETDQ